ncbi:10617_t:CDS:2 [Racocetra fulgida]|uniref:10617_t:CDS:1 n=1 Tax=Racocetra fulgida TaxID=60492 RepID=A0A9N9FIA8_9GLOM|nr:10617_t:CDS:2 [Racocetra fulgida]
MLVVYATLVSKKHSRSVVCEEERELFCKDLEVCIEGDDLQVYLLISSVNFLCQYALMSLKQDVQ